jgi:hypothetical protein
MQVCLVCDLRPVPPYEWLSVDLPYFAGADTCVHAAQSWLRAAGGLHLACGENHFKGAQLQQAVVHSMQ